MGRLEGRVAFVTGAARGQGRSHCVRLAEEGADIIALDICEKLPHVPYGQGTETDLAETVRLVEATGRGVVARKGDTRDRAAVDGVLADGLARFGRLDIAVANAGVISLQAATEITAADWDAIISVNLTGTWNVVQASMLALIEGGRGGSITITSSAAGMKGTPHMAHYATTKLGLVGLMRSLAVELGPHSIRVNTLHPTTVDTDMIHWENAWKMFRPDLEKPTKEDVVGPFMSLNALPIPWIEPGDVSNALLWLVSDEARYVTGAAIPVDAGTLIK